MKLELQSMADLSLDEVAGALNRGFADYLWPIRFTRAGLLSMVRRDGIHAERSQVVLGDGEPVGAGLVAVRGWTSRLAGMAIVPEARRQGVGRWLLNQLIARARAAGERAIVLEVIEQNTPALSLYHSAGFRGVRRLLGYTAQAATAEGISPEATSPPVPHAPSYRPSGARRTATSNPHHVLEQVDLRNVARMATVHSPPDLPWQLSGETLAGLDAPVRGYRLGTAYAALSASDRRGVTLQALVVPAGAEGREEAAHLLGTLLARYGDRPWTVPPLFPEEMHDLFDGLGFRLLPLSQVLMELRLASGAPATERDLHVMRGGRHGEGG